MVELSRRQAAAAGVSDRAKFVEGDMYAADISKATVLALFLLPHNLTKLTPKFLALPPGTRIVGNTFAPEGWAADETETVGGDCSSWCTSLLWIVPARVEGTWKTADGQLTLKQDFQMVSGTLKAGDKTIEVSGRLRGDVLTLNGGGARLAGRVVGDRIDGTLKNGPTSAAQWSASRASVSRDGRRHLAIDLVDHHRHAEQLGERPRGEHVTFRALTNDASLAEQDDAGECLERSLRCDA